MNSFLPFQLATSQEEGEGGMGGRGREKHREGEGVREGRRKESEKNERKKDGINYINNAFRKSVHSKQFQQYKIQNSCSP
jgi:hypothetical protein